MLGGHDDARLYRPAPPLTGDRRTDLPRHFSRQLALSGYDELVIIPITFSLKGFYGSSPIYQPVQVLFDRRRQQHDRRTSSSVC